MLTGPERAARQTCRCRRSAGNGTDGTVLLSGGTLCEVPEHRFLGIGDIAKMNLIPTFPVFRPIGSVTPDEARHRAVAVKLDQQAPAPGQEPADRPGAAQEYFVTTTVDQLRDAHDPMAPSQSEHEREPLPVSLTDQAETAIALVLQQE